MRKNQKQIKKEERMERIMFTIILLFISGMLGAGAWAIVGGGIAGGFMAGATGSLGGLLVMLVYNKTRE